MHDEPSIIEDEKPDDEPNPPEIIEVFSGGFHTFFLKPGGKLCQSHFVLSKHTSTKPVLSEVLS